MLYPLEIVHLLCQVLFLKALLELGIILKGKGRKCLITCKYMTHRNAVKKVSRRLRRKIITQVYGH